jgi:hypothetical protein
MHRVTHPLVAAGGLALGAALVLGAATAPAVLLLAVVLGQGLVVAGWHRSLGVPGAVGGMVVGAVGALVCDVLVLAGAGDRPLSALPGVLALVVLAGLVHQLARRDGRDRLNASLSATVAMTALAGLGATYLAASDGEDGLGLVSAAAVSAALVVAGSVLRARLGLPKAVDLAVLLVAAAVSAAGVLSSGLAGGPALAVAASAAMVAWAATLLVARSSAPDPGVAVGLPLVLAGPVAYVLGRLLVG